MFDQRFGGQSPYYFNNGFGPAQQYAAVRKPRFTNPLTEEDKKMLKAQGGFSLFVSDKDMKRAMCTHKDGDQFSLRENADGSHTCWVCGKTFNLVDMSKENVEQITKDFSDILDSIKTYYLDIPEGVVKEFFQMMPFIEKTPDIYDIARNNFHSYENPMVGQYNQGNQLFGMYDSISSPGYMYNPGFGYQQPMGYPQQGFAPQGYTAPVVPNNATPVGGFGYVDNGMPPGSVPVQNQQCAPAQNQQPVTPVSPIPQPGSQAQNPVETVQQTKTFAV